VKGLRFVGSWMVRVRQGKKSQKASGRFGPCGFRRLFCLGDETAYWALSWLKYRNRTGRGALDSLAAVEWRGTDSRPNTNCKNAPRQLDVVSATWKEMEALAHRGNEDKQQGNQPSGREASGSRHERS